MLAALHPTQHAVLMGSQSTRRAGRTVRSTGSQVSPLSRERSGSFPPEITVLQDLLYMEIYTGLFTFSYMCMKSI